MQINRAWLAGVLAYLIGSAARKYGFTFDDQTADMVAGLIIEYALPLLLAWLNRSKATMETAKEAPLPQHVDPDKFIQG